MIFALAFRPYISTMKFHVNAAYLLLLALLYAQESQAKRPLSVVDAIATTRIMADENGKSIFVSPNGQRYVAMLITGDVLSNEVRAELISGRLDSFAEATPVSLVRLTTNGLGGRYPRLGGSYELTLPTMNVPIWLGNERVVFFWEDSGAVRQVVSVDVDTHEIRYLTDHSTDVTHFALSPQGGLFYGASIVCSKTSADKRPDSGLVVTANDAWELLDGCSAWDRRNYENFVITSDHPKPRKIAVVGGDQVNLFPPLAALTFSPDGRQAIFANTIATQDFPSGWRKYSDRHFQNVLKERSENPTGPYARQLEKLFVVDMTRATAKPLWNVPLNGRPWPIVAWSNDGSSVIVGPTLLPTQLASAEGLNGQAVVELEVSTGKLWQLPVPIEMAMQISKLNWLAKDQVEITCSAGQRLLFQKRKGHWEVRSADSSSPVMVKASAGEIRIDLRQGLNMPPVLYATEAATGREKKLLDLNPGLTTAFTLGHVVWLEHKNKDGSVWEGRLYYPVGYRAGRRYPMVVQTHTYASKEEFSLYGKGGVQPALGPGGSVYVAQSMANEDIFVLHGKLIGAVGQPSLLDRTEAQIGAIEEMIEYLVAEGLVDRGKVGIMGHSASGWLAAYAISHSNFPYAAAITDDNKDGSYFQAGLSGWALGLGEEMIGAPPFGKGLEAWLKYSPSLNADRVRTPLLITVSTSGMELSGWEMFSRLRHLGKPVEYYFIPDLSHGSHGLQNPRQLVALQQRAVDWWCFWLKAKEDPDTRKAEQYATWRELRRLQEADRGSSNAELSLTPSVH